MSTDKEKADFEKGKQIALAQWERDHPSIEGGFEAAFIAQGHPPAKAAQMAKIAKDGR